MNGISRAGRVFLSLATATVCATAADYTLTVDAAQSAGKLERFWQKAIGSCHIAMTLSSSQSLNFQEHYALARQELGMQMIRAHGVLNEDVGIYHEQNGQVSYNWTRLDSIYDYLLSVGLKPFVELTFMPYDLATGSGTFGFYGGLPGNISPPRDYTKWRNLCYEFARHCQERYGAEEIESWYWEVWNEPDIGQFFTGNQYEYLKMYDYAVEGLLAANPNLKVGGPSSAVVGWGWIQALIDHCMKENFAVPEKKSVKLDFISWHTYPGYENNNADGTHMAKCVKQVEEILAQKRQQYPGLTVENVLGEWNTTYKGGVSYHNEICASFVAKSVHQMFSDINGCPAPAAAAFWVISDIWEEWDVGASLGFGPMGLILRQRNARKPPYLAFQMLNQMQDDRISLTGNVSRDDPGLNGFATISADGRQIQILIYDHSRGNGETATPLIDQVSLTVANIPFAGSELRLERYGVDRDHNNSFTLWDQAGRPALPSEALWDQMEDAGRLKTVAPETTLAITDGACTLRFEQYQPGVTLLLLSDADVTASRYHACGGGLDQKIRLAVAGRSIELARVGEKKPRGVEIRDLQGRLCAALPVRQGLARWERGPAAAGSYLVFADGRLAARFAFVK